MKHARFLLGLTVVVGTALAAAPGAAQGDAGAEDVTADTEMRNTASRSEAEIIDEPYEGPAGVSDNDHDEARLPIGLGISAGGGYAGFLDDDVNDFIDPGGGWEARVLVGTDDWVSFEASYLGTVNEIDAVGVSDEAYLLGNGATAALRLGLLSPHYSFRPYLSAGFGWMHYSLEDDEGEAAPFNDSEDVFSVPLAGGFSYSHDWLFADLRVQFAPSLDDDLVRDSVNDDAEAGTWRAVANIGFKL